MCSNKDDSQHSILTLERATNVLNENVFPAHAEYCVSFEHRLVLKMNLLVHDIQSENQLNLIQFKTGDIVWAANLGHRFWPAIIRHSFDKCIINDSKINVQFLYDNGRTAMINVKNSILPFDGLDQYLTESKLKLNRNNNRKKIPKQIKTKYRTTTCRSWNLAIQEANILKCIEISKRIPIYDTIWLPFVKSSITSIHKRIKEEKRSKMETADSDESIESGYCSVASTSAPGSSASSSSNQLTSRHLLLDVVMEQFNENVKVSNLLESFGKTVATMEPINFADFDDETRTSLKQLADQMRKQTVVENILLKEVCDFFKEMCNIESAPPKRKRTESTTSSIEDDKDSVRAVLKTYTESGKLNEPKIKKVKTEAETNEINEERHDEYLACDLNVHDEKYLFKTLPNYSVCHYCLEPNDLTVCSGHCGGVYHSNCLQLIPTAKHYKSILMGKSKVTISPTIVYNKNGNKCARCASKPSMVCIFCDADFVESIKICDNDDCLNLFHEKCFESNGSQPITQDRQLCPLHMCRTCKSQIDVPSMKCLLCSAKYHQSSLCIPAGCQLLTNNQMICIEHCTDVQNEANNQIRPLYGDFVWAKLGAFPWWPALVVPPPRIPPKVYNSRKDPHQICVLFFGEHTYGWIWPKYIQLYDGFDTKRCPKRADLQAAINIANEAHKKRLFMNGLSIEEPKHEQPPKPKPKENHRRKNLEQTIPQPKPFKQIPLNLIRTTKLRKQSTELEICQCTEDDPCSCSNRCWNWFSKFECEPDHCPAKKKCQNQNFRNGSQFKTEIKPTKWRGFGLFAVDKIPAFEFIIEYVGEIINQHEFDRRFKTIERTETNFYFMSLDKDVYIDAGECGNDARFINHSCEPNAETEKWMVQGHYRIGIFAKRDIMPGEEITFQYSWGGKSTTKCRCGALKCRGHI